MVVKLGFGLQIRKFVFSEFCIKTYCELQDSWSIFKYAICINYSFHIIKRYKFLHISIFKLKDSIMSNNSSVT